VSRECTETDGAAPTTAHEPSWIARLTALREGATTDHFVADMALAQQGRVFGGLIAAQALAAASRTVAPEALPQSLHLYFVRLGAPGSVRYEVERTRDGRSFATRRVTAMQDGSVILEMLASFHRPEPDADSYRAPTAVAPLEGSAALSGFVDVDQNWEVRSPARAPGSFGPPYWLRSRVAIEDDPVVRACALTYISDMGLMAAASPVDDAVTAPTMLIARGYQAASIDHAIWFHRPFVPESWHWFEAESVNNNDSRGLAVGALYNDEGTRIASVTQEALWRSPL
jgi:acyl-CoA thioesterase